MDLFCSFLRHSTYNSRKTMNLFVAFNMLTLQLKTVACTGCGCMACKWISHLADTFVVKETQSVTKDSGVVPVMSSHCAGDVPPI